MEEMVFTELKDLVTEARNPASEGIYKKSILVCRLFGQAEGPQPRRVFDSLLPGVFLFFLGLLVLLLGCGELFLGPRSYGLQHFGNPLLRFAAPRAGAFIPQHWRVRPWAGA